MRENDKPRDREIEIYSEALELACYALAMESSTIYSIFGKSLVLDMKVEFLQKARTIVEVRMITERGKQE